MRPDSIDPLPERIKTEPVARVNPSRRKERDEQNRDAERRPDTHSRSPKDVPENPAADPDRQVEDSSAPPPGRIPRRGTHLDLIV